MFVYIHDSERAENYVDSLIKVSEYFGDIRDATAWASDRLQSGIGDYAFIQGWLDNRATLIRHSDGFVYFLTIKPVFLEVVGLGTINPSKALSIQKTTADFKEYLEADTWARQALQLEGVGLALLTCPEGVVAAWKLNKDSEISLIAFVENQSLLLQ